jgi:hypothetical protein
MSSREKMIELARRHATSEGAGDLADTLATLEPDPVYELWPVGRAFRGMKAARVFYEHFFTSFQPLIAGYELLREWVTDEGVGQEYRIDLRFPDGREESHRVIGVLSFGRDALSGERVWASERLLQLMFGPAYEQATAIR